MTHQQILEKTRLTALKDARSMNRISIEAKVPYSTTKAFINRCNYKQFTTALKLMDALGISYEFKFPEQLNWK